MTQFQDYFDMSDYDSNHPLYSVKNTKIPGKMNDELAGSNLYYNAEQYDINRLYIQIENV